MQLLSKFLRYMGWGGAIAFAIQPLYALAFLGSDKLPTNVDLPKGELTQLIGKIINTGLEVLGIVAIVLILYAGFMWMTAQGDPEKVTKARDVLVEATVGLIIIALAYSITFYITDSLGTALGMGSSTGQN